MGSDKIDDEKDVVLNGVVAIHVMAKKLFEEATRPCHRCEAMEKDLKQLRENLMEEGFDIKD